MSTLRARRLILFVVVLFCIRVVGVNAITFVWHEHPLNPVQPTGEFSINDPMQEQFVVSGFFDVDGSGSHEPVNLSGAYYRPPGSFDGEYLLGFPSLTIFVLKNT